MHRRLLLSERIAVQSRLRLDDVGLFLHACHPQGVILVLTEVNLDSCLRVAYVLRDTFVGADVWTLDS